MLRNFRLKKGHNKGIGLLELMLSLAIIAILLIMATRYYVSTEGAQKLQSATEMVSATRGAMKTYLIGNNTATPTVTMADLVNAGLLPTSFLDPGASSTSSASSNPWGMGITIGTVTANTFTVVVVTPSTNICDQLAQQVTATQNSIASQESAGCSNSKTMTATYLR